MSYGSIADYDNQERRLSFGFLNASCKSLSKEGENSTSMTKLDTLKYKNSLRSSRDSKAGFSSFSNNFIVDKSEADMFYYDHNNQVLQHSSEIKFKS